MENSERIENAKPIRIRFSTGAYRLTQEALHAQADPSLLRKRSWYVPQIEELHFNGQELELGLKDEASFYRLKLFLQAEFMDITCSCNHGADSWCIHVFRALERIITMASPTYFEKYQPNGVAELSRRYPHLFRIEKTGLGTRYAVLPELHPVFNVHEDCTQVYCDQALALPASTRSEIASPPTTNEDRLQSGCVMVMVSRRTWQIPTIALCDGVLNKPGSAVKYFGQLHTDFANADLTSVDSNRQAIHHLGQQLWENLALQPATILDACMHTVAELLHSFDLWQQVWSKLVSEPMVYLFLYHAARERMGKPQKNKVVRVIPGLYRPELCFRLENRGAFHVFYPVLHINGECISEFDSTIGCFIRRDEYLYLVSSVRDAVLLEWMNELGGKLTIFTEQMPDFEERVLRALRPFYSIEQTGLSIQQSLPQWAQADPLLFSLTEMIRQRVVVDEIRWLNSSAAQLPEYQLLVLVNEAELRSQRELEEIVSAIDIESKRIVPIVGRTTDLVRIVRNGNSLFHYLMQQAETLYTTGSLDQLLSKPVAERMSHRVEAQQWYLQTATTFSELATHAYEIKQHSLAAFLLHQSIESICNGLLLPLEGMQPKTHDLNRLLSYVRGFYPAFSLLLSKYGFTNVVLFNHLEKSYVHARYDPKFQIEATVVKDATQLVLEMISLAQQQLSYS